MRANKISLGLELLNYRNNEYMKQFSMSIKSEMAIVNARIVPIPTFITASPLVMAPVFLKGMLGNLRGKRVAQAATLASWFVVFFCHPQQVPMHDIQCFVREKCTAFIDTDMKIVNKIPSHHPR